MWQLLICYWYWNYWWECDICMTLTPKEATTSLELLWQYLLITLDSLWPVNLSILFTLLLELSWKVIWNFGENLWCCTALYVTIWHCAHYFTISSMSLLIWGQYTEPLAANWHFSIPRWLICSYCRTFLHSVSGKIILLPFNKTPSIMLIELWKLKRVQYDLVLHIFIWQTSRYKLY